MRAMSKIIYVEDIYPGEKIKIGDFDERNVTSSLGALKSAEVLDVRASEIVDISLDSRGHRQSCHRVNLTTNRQTD